MKSLIHNNFTLGHQNEFNYEFAFYCVKVNQATPVKGVHFRDHTAYTIICIGSTEIQMSVCPLTTSIYVKLLSRKNNVTTEITQRSRFQLHNSTLTVKVRARPQ